MNRGRDSQWRIHYLRSCAVAALAVQLAVPVSASEGEAASEPRMTMHEVFAVMSELLPLVLDDERFSEPERRAQVDVLLDRLATSVEHLNDHAESRDMDFQHLSRSLGSAVEEARARNKLGRHEGARFFVLEATQYCIGCHSRLPSARDFPMASKLIENVDLDELTRSEKASLLVVTRRFGDALSTWEELFRDPSESPVSFGYGGDLQDYLTIAVRVEGDYARVRRTLEALQKRERVPDRMKRNIAAWLGTLDAFEKQDQAASPIARARALIGEPIPPEFQDDEKQLLADLLASGLLLRFIDGTQKSDPAVAEAFYLLGVAEARSLGAFWEPTSEFHFEMAIRLAPKAAFAKDALSLLKDQLDFAYGGSSGVHLPADVQSNLRELEELTQEK
jgi:hypothetical protein